MIHITDSTINIHITHQSPMVDALIKAATAVDEPEFEDGTTELQITPKEFIEALIQALHKNTEE